MTWIRLLKVDFLITLCIFASLSRCASVARKEVRSPAQASQSVWKKLVVANDYACFVNSTELSCIRAKGKIVQFSLTDLDEPYDVAINSDGPCVLDKTGLTCWNTYPGEAVLKDGTFRGATQLVGGDKYACALKEGKPICIGQTDDRKKVIPPSGLANVTYLAANDSTICAIVDSRDVACWGEMHSDRQPIPTGLDHLRKVVLQSNFGCVLADSGVRCWMLSGEGFGQYKVPSDIKNPTDVFAYSGRACVIDNGKLKCWGMPDSDLPSDLGVPTLLAGELDSSCAAIQDRVRCWGKDGKDFGAYKIPRYDVGFKKVSVGNNHACGLKLDRQVKCWGDNGNGQGSAGNSTYAVDVIATSNNSCIIVEESGTKELRCWGARDMVLPQNLINPQAIARGYEHACALAQGKVICWGQILHHPAKDYVPEDLRPVSQLVGGDSYNCALEEGGTVRCWGEDLSRQSVLKVPTDLGVVRQLASSASHMCVLSDTGVHCWGFNVKGQTNVPPDLQNPTIVSAGHLHSCALTSQGVRCWGSSTYTQVPKGLYNLDYLASGGSFSCAGGPSGGACWGPSAVKFIP